MEKILKNVWQSLDNTVINNNFRTLTDKQFRNVQTCIQIIWNNIWVEKFLYAEPAEGATRALHRQRALKGPQK